MKIDKLIGKTKELQVITSPASKTPVAIDVKVLATKTQYGREYAEIQPVAGSGKCWVEATKLN